MKTYRKLGFGSLLIAASSLAFSSHGQTIFSQDFNSQTPGNTVSGFTAVTPATAGTHGAVVSAGNAMRLFDNNNASSARVEQDFTPISAVHLSLDFTRNADIAVDPSTASTLAVYVTLGANGLSQGTQANRAIEFRLFSNGQYRMNRGLQDAGGNFTSSSVTSAANFEPSGTTFNTHTLDLFVYTGTPGGATLSYTGPDSNSRVLDANSFSVFLDGAFVTPASGATLNGDFGIFNSAFYAPNTLGRLGFVTGGAAALTGMDYNVDNIVLSAMAIPEPGSISLVLLGLGGLLLARKCR